MRKTSLEAYKSVSFDQKKNVYSKIICALKRMKVGGHFEQIAKTAKLKPDQVWKRLPELVEMKIIYNTGVTRPTSSGRKAMVRQLKKEYLKAI